MSEERADRLNAIVAAAAAAGRAGVTRGDLAAALGIKLSPYLLSLIKEVIDAGWLDVHQEMFKNGVRWRYFYKDARWQQTQYPLSADDYGP